MHVRFACAVVVVALAVGVRPARAAGVGSPFGVALVVPAAAFAFAAISE